MKYFYRIAILDINNTLIESKHGIIDCRFVDGAYDAGETFAAVERKGEQMREKYSQASRLDVTAFNQL